MGRSAKDLAEAEARQQRALALHLQGASYAQIASALGYSGRAGAHVAVKKALADRQASGSSSVEAYEVEAARLDVVIAALSPQVRAGDVLSIDRYLKAIERRTVLSSQIASAAEPEVREVTTPVDEVRRRRLSRGANTARARGAEVANN